MRDGVSLFRLAAQVNVTSTKTVTTGWDGEDAGGR